MLTAATSAETGQEIALFLREHLSTIGFIVLGILVLGLTITLSVYYIRRLIAQDRALQLQSLDMERHDDWVDRAGSLRRGLHRSGCSRCRGGVLGGSSFRLPWGVRPATPEDLRELKLRRGRG